MTTLLLIRHGDNDFLVTHRLAGLLPGVHLNAHGREQARYLARRYGKLPITAIFSSPLERAFETAKPLARAKRMDIQLLDDLIEINPGDWTGKSIEELRTLGEWKYAQNIPARFRFPNGDSYLERQKTIIKAVDRLIQSSYKTDVLACFSHADPIKLCLAYYLAMDFSSMQHLNIPPASVSFLVFDGESIQAGPIAQVDEMPGFFTRQVPRLN